MWELGDPFPLSPRPILRTLNVSADALTANIRVKGRWSTGVLEGREKSGGKIKNKKGEEEAEKESGAGEKED